MGRGQSSSENIGQPRHQSDDAERRSKLHALIRLIRDHDELKSWSPRQLQENIVPQYNQLSGGLAFADFEYRDDAAFIIGVQSNKPGFMFRLAPADNDDQWRWLETYPDNWLGLSEKEKLQLAEGNLAQIDPAKQLPTAEEWAALVDGFEFARYIDASLSDKPHLDWIRKGPSA